VTCNQVEKAGRTIYVKRGKSLVLKPYAAGKDTQATGVALMGQIYALKGSQVTWKSSNKKVARVSKTGKVTVVKSAKPGKKAKITATLKGTKKKATYTISVTKKSGKILYFSAKTSRQDLYVGQQIPLGISGAISGTPSTPIRWKSSKPALLSVNADGVVSAKAPGTVKVTATCAKKKASFTITVKPVQELLDLALGR
jgi:uncharacterized protein YjdB